MIPMWENKLYFFLACGIAVLLLIYWFRRRGKVFLTGGTFLWKKNLSESSLSSRMTVQKLPLSFYLETGALLLLACGAAGLMTAAKEELPPAVVMLNNAYSMEGRCRTASIKMLRGYLKRFPGRRVIWLRCGRDVELLSSSDGKFDFEKHWEGCDAEFDAGKAVAYAEKNFSGAEIVMVTDRLPGSFRKGKWTLLLSGTKGDNIALSNARMKGERILLEISSFADREMNVQLKVNDQLLESFAIKHSERRIFNFRLPIPQKQLKFTLSSPGDLLEYDNEVLLLNTPAAPVRYKLGTKLSPEEKRVLAAVFKNNPDFLAVSKDPELLIDRYSKEKKKEPGQKLFFHKGGSSPRFLLQSPFFRENEKILEGLNTSSLKWAFYPEVKIPGKGVIFSQEHSLLSVEKTKNLEYAFHLNLAAGFSNLHSLPFWPVLFFNLGEFCRQNRPGPREINLHSNEVLVCNVSGENSKLLWECRGEKGELPVSGTRSVLQVKKKGIYTLSDGKQKFTVSVNPRITSVSDLRHCKTEAFYADLETLDRGNALKKWSWIFIAGALLLLVFNYHWNFRSRK